MSQSSTLLHATCRACGKPLVLPTGWVDLDSFAMTCAACGEQTKLDPAAEAQVLGALRKEARAAAAKLAAAQRALDAALGPRQDN